MNNPSAFDDFIDGLDFDGEFPTANDLPREIIVEREIRYPVVAYHYIERPAELGKAEWALIAFVLFIAALVGWAAGALL